MLVDLGLRGHIRGAINLALGTFISDILSVLLIYFIAQNFVTNAAVLNVLYIIGGIILVVVGLKQLFKTREAEVHYKMDKKDRRKLLLKGFLINSTNPNVFFFWFGAVMIAMQTYQSNTSFVLIHFFIALLLVFTTDCLKLFAAAMLKPYIKDNTLLCIGKISGVIIIAFGIKLIFFH